MYPYTSVFRTVFWEPPLLFLAADQTRMMQDQMSGAAMSVGQDPTKAFKAEWEALQICDHQWALDGVENDVCGAASVSPETVHIKNDML